MPTFDALEAGKKVKAMNDTWGHLKPSAGKPYEGFVLFTHSTLGDIDLLDFDFKGLDSSPWLYDDIWTLIDSVKTTEGNLYRWKGFYTQASTGEPVFAGTREAILLKDIIK